MNFKRKTKLMVMVSLVTAILVSMGGLAISAYAKTSPIRQDTSSYIGLDAAKSAALAHAGVPDGDTHYCNRWLEYKNKLPAYYKVEFVAGSISYEYEIDLYSGEVLNYSTEQLNYSYPPASAGSAGSSGSSASDSVSSIGLSAAKQVAFNHAGLSESQVSSMDAKLKYHSGLLVYDVEFEYNGMDHEYTVDAATGNILEYDCRNSIGSTDSSNSGTTGNVTNIGQDAAKQVAFTHAGIFETQASKLKIKQDRKDGRLQYKVEFECGKEKYKYTIDAATGNILKID